MINFSSEIKFKLSSQLPVLALRLPETSRMKTGNFSAIEMEMILTITENLSLPLLWTKNAKKSFPVRKPSVAVIVVRKITLCLTSSDIGDVDTVWTWGGQTSTPLISKYFSEIFSLTHKKLTYHNPNKDFKSVKRP